MNEREAQLRSLACLLRDAPLNLLSPKDREAVWERHVAESERVARDLVLQPGQHWIDVGTGGGLPGLVFAIVAPQTSFTLLDARAKKIAAVDGFVRALALDNVQAVAGRAETQARLPELRESFDGAVSRALGSLPTVVELSRGFIRPGGILGVIRGAAAPQEVEELGALGRRLAVTEVTARLVPDTARETWLVTMRAEGTCPRAIPRGDGIPASRPLATN